MSSDTQPMSAMAQGFADLFGMSQEDVYRFSGGRAPAPLAPAPLEYDMTDRGEPAPVDFEPPFIIDSSSSYDTDEPDYNY